MTGKEMVIVAIVIMFVVIAAGAILIWIHHLYELKRDEENREAWQHFLLVNASSQIKKTATEIADDCMDIIPIKLLRAMKEFTNERG